MTMADTSLKAFEGVKLQEKEEAVFETLKELGVATNDGIAAQLDWPIQSVTGRTNSLCKKGLIVVVDKDGITTLGNKAKRWGIADPSYRQLSFIKEQDCEG